MKDGNRLDNAQARLSSALAALENAVARRLENDASLADAQEELAVMRDDRVRLALDLDEALARVGMLEKARDEAMRRIENASAEVSAALGGPPAGAEE